MEVSKSIASLKWSKKHHPLSEVLHKLKLPSLVRVQEGYYGLNDACSFEVGQHLVLHTMRSKQNYMAEDSAGRPVSIPVECGNKLLVCPLSIHCGYDPIHVSEMFYVFPDVKYFRVLENNCSEDIGLKAHFLPKSVLEVERIDVANSVVIFRDVHEPVPFSCGIIFEALMDYREYTLRDAVRAFGLPIKVLFLPSKYDEQSPLDGDFENIVSNLGKTTIIHSPQPELLVVATKIDEDQFLILSETSVKCSQISTNCKLNVSLAKEITKNNPVYLKMLHDFNEEFLEKYDLNELDSLDKCQYLDRPDGLSKPDITGSVLVAKALGQNNNAPKIFQRNRSRFETSPPLPPRNDQPEEKGNTASIFYRPLQIGESVPGHDAFENIEKVKVKDGNDACKCEDPNQKAKSSWQCHLQNLTPLSPKEKCRLKVHHEYEEIDAFDDEGLDKDIYGYEFVNYGVNKTIQKSVFMTSEELTAEEYVDMSSENYVDMTPDEYVDMTSPEYMKMMSQKGKARKLSEYVNNPGVISPPVASQSTSGCSGNTTGKTASEPGNQESEKLDFESGNIAKKITPQAREEKFKISPKDMYKKRTIKVPISIPTDPLASPESMIVKTENNTTSNETKVKTPSRKVPICIPSDPLTSPKLKSGGLKSSEETFAVETKNNTTSNETKVKTRLRKVPVSIPTDPPTSPKPKSGRLKSSEEITMVKTEDITTSIESNVWKPFKKVPIPTPNNPPIPPKPPSLSKKAVRRQRCL
ncbi:uncharacterized protein LOC114535095 [Dendronephthya gigantea]|uniref:uncharacterized protein LOC114535095 n=1 Tax=Dendronephthya gigantea TaxID=151771 RepID=UPI00106A4C71|nr:uncharacterized protein LOC114535095 [Dendronephthya gigantea]